MVFGFGLFNKVSDSKKNEIRLDVGDSPNVEKKKKSDPFESLYETREERRSKRHEKIKRYKSKINEYRAKARAAKEAYHGFLNEPEIKEFRARVGKANQDENNGFFDFHFDLGTVGNTQRQTKKRRHSNDPFDFSDILD